jgi:organic hydroperoxide reductase OsmC/OhrA
MHPYPHVYQVSADATNEGDVRLGSADLTTLPSMPPPEFGGPPGYWSPETLLAAAVADCFVLSFRAVARAAKFEWTRVSAEVDAVLDRVDGVAHFIRFTTRAHLVIPAGGDAARARRLMEKAEKVCLISNSLKGERHLESEVVEG